VDNCERERQEAWRVLDGHYERQEFEHQVIDRKTTWLLSTQAILFAAYGVTFSKGVSGETVDEFRRVVAWTGIALSVFTLAGVLALVTSKRLYLAKYRKYFARNAPPGPDLGDPIAWGAKTWVTVLSLAPDIAFPVVVTLAWSALLGARGVVMWTWIPLAVILVPLVLLLVRSFRRYRRNQADGPDASGDIDRHGGVGPT
jgi:hypothetical protein